MATRTVRKSADVLDNVRASVWPHRFPIALLLIMLVGAALRVPGVLWLHDVAPEPNFTFHPDERRFITAAAEFEDKPSFNYVQGMTTHLYVVKEFARLVLNKTVDLVVTARIVSVIYGVVLVGLVGVMVRSLTSSTNLALLTAAFLALAPAHIISSHFGTPDSAVTFWFVLACFFGWLFAKTGQEVNFLACAAAVGVAMAIKFPVSLIVLLAILVLIGLGKLQRAFIGFLVAVLSFLAANFFSLTPWDFARFLYLLYTDAVVVTAGNSMFENILYYSHGSISALGLGAALSLLIGLGFATAAAVHRAPEARASLGDLRKITALARHPNTILAIPFLLYCYLILGLEVSNIRYLLPVLPILCLGAAFGFEVSVRKLQLPAPAIAALVGLVFGYQIYNAVGIERYIQHDVRNAAAQWLADNLGDREEATAFLDYSRVRGVRSIQDPAKAEALVDSDFFVTSSIEYVRYFKGSEDASEVLHSYGGQRRLDFFRDLFSNRTQYRPVAEFRSEPFTFEQKLIEEGVLLPVVRFTPRRFIVFARSRKDADPD